MSLPFIPIPDVLHITSQRLVIRRDFSILPPREKTKSKAQQENEENLKRSNASGLVTRKVRQRMTRILDTWLRCMKYSEKDRKGRAKVLPTFCTLTLPAKQMHKDGEVHKMLNYFITESWQGYGGKRFRYYFWRAERQKNGNIHYHILFDAYIDWQHIKLKWNNILNRYGYIDAYRKNNNKGADEMPNSTDIHALKKVKNVTQYIMKYCTKDAVLSKPGQEIKLDESQRIKGRVWGCSAELKTLKEAQISEHEMSFSDFVAEVKETAGEKGFIQDEQVTIIYSWKIPEILNRYPRLKKRVIDHYKEAYYRLYPGPVKMHKGELFVLPGYERHQVQKSIRQSAIDFEF